MAGLIRVYDSRGALREYDPLFVNDVEISSGLILECYTTPIPLVAAPGAGKFIEPITLILTYDYGGTQYNVSSMGAWRMRYAGDNTWHWQSTLIAANGFIDQTSDEVRISYAKTEDTLEPFLNWAIELVTTSGNPSAGNGVIHARVYYRIIDTRL